MVGGVGDWRGGWLEGWVIGGVGGWRGAWLIKELNEVDNWKVFKYIKMMILKKRRERKRKW